MFSALTSNTSPFGINNQLTALEYIVRLTVLFEVQNANNLLFVYTM